MSNKIDSLHSVLYQLFDFCRIDPDVTIIVINPVQGICGKLNRIGSEHPRFISKMQYKLSIKHNDFEVGVKEEARGLGCAIFVIAYAFLYKDARLKKITVVHKDLEALTKAAEEDTELFGEFELGHCVYNGVNLQHAQSVLEGFQIHLTNIDDPKQMLQELIHIFRKQLPSLRFKTNKKNFYSTGVITIPIDKFHQIELYLEKKT